MFTVMKLLLLFFALCTVGIGAFDTVDLNNFGYFWRDWDVNRDIPKDAVPGGIGKTGHKTYIARSIYPKVGVMVPGKACPVEKKMWFEYSNAEHARTEDVQILCALNRKRLQWLDANMGDRVDNVVKDNILIIGGHNKPIPVGIGKQVIGDEVRIGKVAVDQNNKFKHLRLTQNGRGWGVAKGFQVLVYSKNESIDCGSIKLQLN